MASQLRATLKKQMVKAGGKFQDLSTPALRRSTGSLLMDVQLKGGLTEGRITELYGPPNSGKSTLAILKCRYHINMGEPVLYIDQELDFDPVYARRLGLEVDAVDDNGEGLFDVYQPPNAEVALQMMLDAIRANAYRFIVFDSIAMISPQAEQETGFDKRSQLGAQAFLMTRFCRVIGPPLAYSNTTVLALNQVRDDIGSMHGGKMSTGGNAFHHKAALRIQTLSPKSIWDNGTTRQNLDKLIIRWKQIKNKVTDFSQATNEVTLEFFPDDTIGIDEIEELFQLCKMFGIWFNAKDEVWDGKGAAFHRMIDEDGIITHVNLGTGQVKIKETLAESFTLVADLTAKVWEAMERGDNATTEVNHDETPEGEPGGDDSEDLDDLRGAGDGI